MARIDARRLAVYLVTDPVLVGQRDLVQVVESVLKAGVQVVQFRDKSAPTRILVAMARKLADLAKKQGAILIVNDRVDVAMVSGAHGVHLGQEDMEVADARRILGADAVIGVSVRTIQEAQRAVEAGADYVAASHVFPTGTKDIQDPPLGLEGVSALSKALDVPLVGIGGIGPENAADVVRAGADGVAVVSAILAARDPVAAAKAMQTAVSDGLKARGGHLS